MPNFSVSFFFAENLWRLHLVLLRLQVHFFQISVWTSATYEDLCCNNMENALISYQAPHRLMKWWLYFLNCLEWFGTILLVYVGIDVPLNPVESRRRIKFCRFGALNSLERELTYQGEEWFAAPDSGFQILAPAIKSHSIACSEPYLCLNFLHLFPVFSFFVFFFFQQTRVGLLGRYYEIIRWNASVSRFFSI